MKNVCHVIREYAMNDKWSSPMLTYYVVVVVVISILYRYTTKLHLISFFTQIQTEVAHHLIRSLEIDSLLSPARNLRNVGVISITFFLHMTYQFTKFCIIHQCNLRFTQSSAIICII